MSGVIWSAGDTLSLARMNHKTILAATGAQIAAVTAAGGGVAGMIAYCISTGSNFTQNKFYCRTVANDGWYVITDGTNDIVPSGTKVTGTT